MKLSDFDFTLPAELIAQRPLPKRRDSRLLVLQNGHQTPLHRHFYDLLDYLNAGDVLVLNNTKVFPARLFGHKVETGGKVEILLARAEPDGTWIALSRGRLDGGCKLALGSLNVTVLSRVQDEPGAYRIAFDGDILSYAENFGQVPLPPYIEREADETDLTRFQTVFADPAQNQAVAAPTAGLHFDEALLETIKAKGVRIAYVTLHVGPGTFLPIRNDNLDEHQMHAEPWSISQETADIINKAKKDGHRIIAVGTTSVRTLESASRLFSPFEKGGQGDLRKSSGLTRLFIRPGFKFHIVDAFVTNFHLPKTTLLLLVAAAIGEDRLKRAYKEAISERYRFFSYGDACFFDVVEFSK